MAPRRLVDAHILGRPQARPVGWSLSIGVGVDSARVLLRVMDRIQLARAYACSL